MGGAATVSGTCALGLPGVQQREGGGEWQQEGEASSMMVFIGERWRARWWPVIRSGVAWCQCGMGSARGCDRGMGAEVQGMGSGQTRGGTESGG